MKIKSYKVLFRIFSFLSDKTNGASLFVKYKLILGALLVGLTTVSCDKNEEEQPLTCYLVASPEEDAGKSALDNNPDQTDALTIENFPDTKDY